MLDCRKVVKTLSIYILQWIARYVNVNSFIIFYINLIFQIYANNDKVISFPKGFLTKLSHPCLILLSTFFLKLFIMYVLFVCWRKVRKSQLNSSPPLALIIYAEEALKMASTSFTIPMETVTQFTVTWSLSQAPHGLWWCHGALEIEVFQNSAAFPSR